MKKNNSKKSMRKNSESKKPFDETRFHAQVDLMSAYGTLLEQLPGHEFNRLRRHKKGKYLFDLAGETLDKMVFNRVGEDNYNPELEDFELEDGLREQLQRALECENYELAAKLKDKIKKLKK